MTEPTTRTCKKCHVEKPLAEFSPKGRWCRACNALDRRERREYEAERKVARDDVGMGLTKAELEARGDEVVRKMLNDPTETFKHVNTYFALSILGDGDDVQEAYGEYCRIHDELGRLKDQRREERWREVKAAAKAQKKADKADKARRAEEFETPWRELYQVHAAAGLFPMMTDEELDDLGADILANGLRSPIVTCGQPAAVLDGRNRLEAIDRVGLWAETVPTTFPGPSVIHLGDEVDPVAFVMSANLKRRHLNEKQRRDLVAELLKLAPERSDRSVAKDAGVSHPTVAKVRSELKDADDVEILSTPRTRIDRHGHRRPSTQKPRPILPRRGDVEDAYGGLDEELVRGGIHHHNTSKAGQVPDVVFARLLVNLYETNVAALSMVDLSDAHATPGQIAVLTKVIRALTSLRRTVSKNQADLKADDVIVEGDIEDGDAYQESLDHEAEDIEQLQEET